VDERVIHVSFEISRLFICGQSDACARPQGVQTIRD